MDRYNRTRHPPRIPHGPYNLADALHAAEALDRKAKSHRRLRPKTPVSAPQHPLSNIKTNSQLTHSLSA